LTLGIEKRIYMHNIVEEAITRKIAENVGRYYGKSLSMLSS